MCPVAPKNVDVDLTLADKVRKDEPPDIIKLAALEHFERYENSFKIYTDGSRSNAGTVSSAFYVKNSNEHFKYRISNGLTIYTAELIAIKQSLSWIKNNESKLNNNNNIVIFSDSKSSLESIKIGRSKLRPNLLAL